jgi:hypothetical protein
MIQDWNIAGRAPVLSHAQEIRPADENLSRVPTLLCLAKEVGAALGRGYLLLGTVPA